MARYRYDPETDQVVCVDMTFGRGAPDVFFKEPYRDENIVDENKPETWEGTWIHSKQHKASEMKKLGLREAGDSHHGARNYEKRRTYFT